MKRMIALGVLLAVLGFGVGQAIAAMDPPRVPLKGQEGPGIRAKVGPRGLEGPDVRHSTLPLPKGPEGPDGR